MMPAEAERALREESAASSADSLERRFSDAIPKLQDKYRALVRFYGRAEGSLIPRSLGSKLEDTAIQKIIDWVLADFLGWCCFTSACSAFRERGEVNGRFLLVPEDSRLVREEGRSGACCKAVVEKHSVFRRGRPAGGVPLVLGLAALLAVSSCRSTAPAPLERQRACGFYRWRVKTLSDPDAEKVRTEPVDMTIHDLVRLRRPKREAHGRRREIELQAYRVRGLLLAVESRRDRDLHLLLSDPADPKSRLIAEIPNPACSMGSIHASDFASAGQVAESLRGKPRGESVVEVVGIGFFDIGHIQKGRSHNGLELHPVLKVREMQSLAGGRTAEQDVRSPSE